MDSYEDIYSDDFFESEKDDEFSTIEVSKQILHEINYVMVNLTISKIFKLDHKKYLNCLNIGRSGKKFG